jgi:phosphate transport system protein
VIGVLRHLFNEEHPLQDAGVEFSRMLTLASNMVRRSSQVYWGAYLSPQEADVFHRSDADVDRLQREVRKRLMRHFSIAPRTAGGEDAARGLMLMSLVKDVERLGDYAKNLLEVHSVSGRGAGDIPEDGVGGRLRRVAEFAVGLFSEIGDVFSGKRRERALPLLLQAVEQKRACDEIVFDVARCVTDVGVAVDLTLASRHYKRIIGHGCNLLSGLLVPVHRLDQFDSKGETDSVRPPSVNEMAATGLAAAPSSALPSEFEPRAGSRETDEPLAVSLSLPSRLT